MWAHLILNNPVKEISKTGIIIIPISTDEEMKARTVQVTCLKNPTTEGGSPNANPGLQLRPHDTLLLPGLLYMTSIIMKHLE